jgi:hypothetical protein
MMRRYFLSLSILSDRLETNSLSRLTFLLSLGLLAQQVSLRQLTPSHRQTPRLLWPFHLFSKVLVFPPILVSFSFLLTTRHNVLIRSRCCR